MTEPQRDITFAPLEVPKFDSNLLSQRNAREQSQIDHDDILKMSLQFRRERITILRSKPSDTLFPLWFIISCYVPVVTACVGPLANMISIAGVVGNWRMVDDINVRDPPIIWAFNIISLVIGCASNVVLLLHFSKKLSYLKSQLFNIVGWFVAGIILLVDLVLFRHFYPGKTTIGFWYAVFTVLMYISCSLTLIIHYIGYRMGEYPPTFNLVDSERGVMIFTFLLSIWFIWGALMFSKIMHISYGNALYFCAVSLLTIGLGDIPPDNDASRALILVYSLSGVIILGLIIAMTRGIISSSSGPIFFMHFVEMKRIKVYDKLRAERVKVPTEQAFHLMKLIRHEARRKQRRNSLLATAAIFIAFWMIGGMIFYLVEDNWGYFDSIYFCFLCLLTIGYGDFAPTKPAARAFFVLWALSAVPLMTALISTVGDALYASAETLNTTLSRITGLLKTLFPVFSFGSNEAISITPPSGSDSEDDITSDSEACVDDEDEESVDDLVNRIARRNSTVTVNSSNPVKEKVVSAFDLVAGLREMGSRFKNNPGKFTFEEWGRYFSLLEGDTTSADLFWVSSKSPLRLPLDEPRFMFAKMFQALEKTLNDLLSDDMESYYTVDPTSTVSLNPETLYQTNRQSFSGLSKRRRANSI